MTADKATQDFAPNWLDQAIAWFSPRSGLDRVRSRRLYAALTGYESSEATRRRRFHRNSQTGDALARTAATPLRNQARHLERNHDIARSALQKLVDFTIGTGISTQFAPKRKDGTIHRELASMLNRAHAQWSEWPEVTWTHNRGAMERLAMRSQLRDGEVFGKLVYGDKAGLRHGSVIPLSVELLEADVLPHDFDDLARNISQGIERNEWGRPRGYHFYKRHPGDDRLIGTTLERTRVDAEYVLHPRLVDRIGQLRGVTMFAPVIARLQDLWEYEESERLAAKMAANMVMKITSGAPEMFNPESYKQYGQTNPPIWQTDAGMIVAQGAMGENVEFFDSKRPNPNAESFSELHVRRVAAGVGLSYSAVSRNYNGSYSAQRQELVENWPHYHAITGIWVSQWNRPLDQLFVSWFVLQVLRGRLPADLDEDTLDDVEYLGPPMPWIDPLKEGQAELLLVQAGFKSSGQVVRQRGGNLDEIYQAQEYEQAERARRGLHTTLDAGAPVSPAKTDSTDDDAGDDGAERNRAHLRAIK